MKLFYFSVKARLFEVRRNPTHIYCFLASLSPLYVVVHANPPGVDKEPDIYDGGADTDEHKPVDVDMNLVKNLLESTASQAGLSGPASNILRSMGLNFPSVPTGSRIAKQGPGMER